MASRGSRNVSRLVSRLHPIEPEPCCPHHLQLVQSILRKVGQGRPPRPSLVEDTPVCHRYASRHTPKAFPSRLQVVRTENDLRAEILGPCNGRTLG